MIQTKKWHRWVEEYFDSTLLLYLFYSKEHHHFGIWDSDTSRNTEALMNATKYVVNRLDIEEGDVILDAGCGVGGTSRYIASNFKAKIIGINISKAQVRKARERSQRGPKNPNLKFFHQDFTRTSFPDRSFTKIFAIEAVCHTPNKLGFLKEAYRLLRTGGKIFIVDGFLGKSNNINRAKKEFQEGLKGWAVASFDLKENFISKLLQAGFHNISFQDKTRAVMKTSWILHRRAKMIYPMIILLSKLKIIPPSWYGNMKSSIIQKRFFDNNSVCYGIFIANK